MAGKTTPALDKEFEVYIKKVEFGDFTSGQDQMVTYDGITRTTTAAKFVKGSKKICPNVGSKFNFEGKGIMVNILGQVVATGTSSIDASSFAAGVYYIIIDGIASKVIVK